LGTTDAYKAFDAQRQIASGIIARGLGGQKGPMSDRDQDIVKKYIVNEWDTNDQAQSKSLIFDTDSLQMMRSQLDYLKASNYDVSKFEDLYNTAKTNYDVRVNQLKAGAPDAVKHTLDALQLNAITQAHKDELKSLYRPTQAPTGTEDQDKSVRTSGIPLLRPDQQQAQQQAQQASSQPAAPQPAAPQPPAPTPGSPRDLSSDYVWSAGAD